MAKRFGGEFSPDGQTADPANRQSVTAPARPELASFKGRSPQRHGAKINLLFLAGAISLATFFFQGSTLAMATDLAGAAMLLLAAWLTRDGIRAEDAYMERKVARRPAIPRKAFASVGVGIGVGLLIYGGQWQIAPAVLMGAISAGLHLFTFGLDPMADKGLEGVDSFQTDRVARKIEEAEAVLAQMKDAVLRARDRELETRVDSFQHTVRQMFRQVESDPRDLSAARKYLGVYLQGARDATIKFADLYSNNRDASVRSDYVGLLDDLESNFTKRTKTMLTDNRSDLDVEIGVLRERLIRDNIHISD